MDSQQFKRLSQNSFKQFASDSLDDNLKIYRHGTKIMVITEQYRNYIDLSQSATEEAIKQLGHKLEYFKQFKNYSSFLEEEKDQNMAQMKYQYYKRNFINFVKEVDQKCSMIQNKHKVMNDSFRMNSQENGRSMRSLNSNNEIGMNRWNHLTQRMQTQPDDDSMRLKQGNSISKFYRPNITFSNDHDDQSRIEKKQQKYLKQRQQYALNLMENQSQRVQLLQSIQTKQVSSQQKCENMIQKRRKEKQEKLELLKQKHELILRQEEGYLQQQEMQRKKLDEKQKQADKKIKEDKLRISQAIKVKGEHEQMKNKQTIMKRSQIQQEFEQYRDQQDQFIQKKINEKRMIHQRNVEEFQYTHRCKTMEEFNKFKENQQKVYFMDQEKERQLFTKISEEHHQLQKNKENQKKIVDDKIKQQQLRYQQNLERLQNVKVENERFKQRLDAKFKAAERVIKEQKQQKQTRIDYQRKVRQLKNQTHEQFRIRQDLIQEYQAEQFFKKNHNQEYKLQIMKNNKEKIINLKKNKCLEQQKMKDQLMSSVDRVSYLIQDDKYKQFIVNHDNSYNVEMFRNLIENKTPKLKIIDSYKSETIIKDR